MNLKELNFCSASIILHTEEKLVSKLVKKYNMSQKQALIDDKGNLDKSLFFNINDLLELKEKSNLFKIIYKLVESEEKELKNIFPNIEDIASEENLEKYLCKGDAGNVDLKILSLFYYCCKFENFNEYIENKNIYKVFVELYISLMTKISLEACGLLAECKQAHDESLAGADFEKISRKLYSDLKIVKENNIILSAENKKLTKVNKSQIKQIENLNKEVLKTKNYIENTIKKTIDGNNKELIETFKTAKYDVLESTYNSTLDKLTDELGLARADSKMLSQKIASLTKENRELKEQISLQNEEVKKIPKTPEEKKEMKTEIKDTKLYDNYFKDSFIVWCKDIENMIGVKSDGSQITIKNIATLTYLTKGDFVLVAKDGSFLKTLEAYTDKNVYPNIKFAIITIKNNTFYATKEITGEVIEIDTALMRSEPRENMVIGLDAHNKIKVVFKRSLHSLDSYRDIIKLKKHRILYVLKTLNKGYLVRDCFNDSEEFINMYIKNIEDGDLIIVNEKNEYLGDLPSTMYLQSSLNVHKNYYTIFIENDNVYGKHQNGATILLSKPSNLLIKNGDLAAVDEFDNILYLVDCETKEKLVSRFKKVTKTITINDNKCIDYLGEILIIGNVNYRDNYNKSFENMFYKTSTVSGYDSYKDISFDLSKYDYIICVVSHCSHDNMFRLKKENLNNIIYTNHNGANQLVNELKDFMEQR